MGIPLSKNVIRPNAKLKLNGNKAGKTSPYRQAIKVADDHQGDICHADVCNADILKHSLTSECKLNSDVPRDRSQYPLVHRNSKLSSLTLLKGPIYRPDSSRPRINTTPNIAETIDKFVQAGVGYASLRDSETNTFRPIFPYNYGIAPQIVSSRAEKNGEKPMDHSKILLSREKRGKTRVQNCIAKVMADSLNSKRHAGKHSITELSLPIKFRFLLKQREDVDKMLNDAEDRRIRTICERFQCDLDVYEKKIIAGYLQYVVDISAEKSSSLLGCVRNLDSALGWNLTPQLISSNLLPRKSALA